MIFNSSDRTLGTMHRRGTDLGDPGIHVGKTVVGAIETEFECGYLVTVTIGSEKLNGILYQIKDTTLNQFAVVPNLMDNASLEDSDAEPVGLRIRVRSVKQESAELKPVVELSGNDTDMKPTGTASSENGSRHLKLPRRSKNPYQIFLCRECDRLKKLHGNKTKGKNIRKTANDAWKCLSESDKLPYIEESKKDKERFDQEMAAYYKKQKDQLQAANTSSDFNNDCYCVSLQTEEPCASSYLPDESMAEFAAELMKQAEQLDGTLQIRWEDEFLSTT